MKLNHLTIGQRLGLLAAVLLIATLFIGSRGLVINADGLTTQYGIDREPTRMIDETVAAPSSRPI